MQIEQFIESIFPSQPKPLDEKTSPISAEEAAKAKKQAEEDRRDVFYMGLAVFITLSIITASMVSNLKGLCPSFLTIV